MSPLVKLLLKTILPIALRDVEAANPNLAQAIEGLITLIEGA